VHGVEPHRSSQGIRWVAIGRSRDACRLIGIRLWIDEAGARFYLSHFSVLVEEDLLVALQEVKGRLFILLLALQPFMMRLYHTTSRTRMQEAEVCLTFQISKMVSSFEVGMRLRILQSCVV
jgi:hypothetical protein